MKIIRDPIHKDIELDEFELKILDTAPVQRLRRIKQNGLCFLVYPAMNSTRFEHSIGVMHLAGKVATHLGLDYDNKKKLRIAGLLHDIGHISFSHTLKLKNFSHEENSCNIIRNSELKDIIRAYGFDENEICNLILGKGRFGKILSSDIDVDKMDYLSRDSFYAGVAYGTIDVDRIIHGMRFSEQLNDVFITAGALEAVENLLIGRNLMYQAVYRHHAKRIAESMFKKAFDLASEGEDIKKFIAMDDFDLINFLRNSSGYSKEIMNRIDNRRLFKRFFVEKFSNISDIFIKEIESDSRKIESKICDDLGIEYNHLLVDVPEIRMHEFNIKISDLEIEVEDESGLKRIDEVSELAKALEKSERDRLTFCIYVDEKYKHLSKHFNPEKHIYYKQTILKKFI